MSCAVDGAAAVACGADDWASIVEPANRVRAEGARECPGNPSSWFLSCLDPAQGRCAGCTLEIEPRQAAGESQAVPRIFAAGTRKRQLTYTFRALTPHDSAWMRPYRLWCSRNYTHLGVSCLHSRL